MKEKFLTKRNFIIFLACIAIISAILSFISVLTAYVAFAYTGQSGNMTKDQLHSETLAASVSTDTPGITIFTHGLGGSAGHWSNNFNGTKGSGDSFAYDSNSIIEKMRSSSDSEIDLYRAKTNSSSNFTLYSEYHTDDTHIITTISEFSNHTIVVMDIPNTKSNSMEELYEQLHYVVDKISYDYYILNNCLPRINLVGHSMGGLLNMQYAIEHPKNVAALVSLGTPYNGSWYDNWFVNLFIKEFQEQPCITGTCGHNYYFCNLETRRDTWNDVYSENTHIKFYALSGSTDRSLMNHIVMTNNYLESYGGMNSVAATAVRAGFVALGTLPALLPGDICVDADSQKAVGYDGVITYNKVFASGNCNVNKRSTDNFPVPHNLETYDVDMQNCILRIINYGNDMPYNSYTQNGITVSIITKSEIKWLIQLTNNTGSTRSFEYNQMMCFEEDAQNWNGLYHVECTDVLANGASTIIEISEFLLATSITISYDAGGTRYIFYGNYLDTSGTMNSYSSISPYYSYTANEMKVGIVSKGSGIWSIKLTNNTGADRSFEFNQLMCSEFDAKNWSGLSNVARTLEIKDGESTIIHINENLAATCIVVSYTEGDKRYIVYADHLLEAGTMDVNSVIKEYYRYAKNNMEVCIIGKNMDTWLIELTNNTGKARSFDYNGKMCDYNDARDWTDLSDIKQTEILQNGETVQIEISENGFATSIAISYTSGSQRYIFYADNLKTSGTLDSYASTTPTYSYVEYGMKVGIIGKDGSTWILEVTNNTGAACKFYYNEKMCSATDAQNWTGLSDIKQTEILQNGETVQIEISENGFATSIAISYISNNTRYIFFADDLDAEGTMIKSGHSKSYSSYTECGIKVSIAGKSGSTWILEVTNNTGSTRTFYYNKKMCYSGDAKDWQNLSDVLSFSLNNGDTKEIRINENGIATSIAISYMDGIYRKIFYAYDLKTEGTMSAFGRSLDTTATDDGCVAEGTLITLSDGSQKAVEDLTGDEMLLVWNLETGEYDIAPIMFIDSDELGNYKVVELEFSDGTTVDVISEHGFWDVDLNRYVYLDEDASQYIGHSFLKKAGNGMAEVMLVGVEISEETTMAYSPVTYGHLCYYVNGMLSMPGGITGLFNIFEVDAETMTIDEEAFAADIAEYGLFTYEEFYEMYPVSEEVFDAFNGKYLKVAIGKGMITEEQIGVLIERYSEFF